MTNNFDVFSGVPKSQNNAKQATDKKSLPFDYIDSDESSEDVAYDNLGKLLILPLMMILQTMSLINELTEKS